MSRLRCSVDVENNWDGCCCCCCSWKHFWINRSLGAVYKLTNSVQPGGSKATNKGATIYHVTWAGEQAPNTSVSLNAGNEYYFFSPQRRKRLFKYSSSVNVDLDQGSHLSCDNLKNNEYWGGEKKSTMLFEIWMVNIFFTVVFFVSSRGLQI